MSEDYILLRRGSDMPDGTDFCLRLDNDCMEPFLKKGELVCIDRHDTPEEMQPGLFYYQGRGQQRHIVPAVCQSETGKRKSHPRQKRKGSLSLPRACGSG